MDKNHWMSAPRDAIKWWELRRIPFNAGMLVAGSATLAAWAWVNGQMVTDSQDVGEPFFIIFLAVPLYALVANLLYTRGWLTEADGNARTPAERRRTFRKWFIRALLITIAPGLLILARWASWKLLHV
jgi:hypothetical protein